MIRNTVYSITLLAFVIGISFGDTKPANAQDETAEEKPVYFPVDTPLYTLAGPEDPTIALIQTGEEVEYIGDYLGLDERRARNALRLLRHLDFEESMLLVVNGGRVEGEMLRVESVYEEGADLHVIVVTADPPQQYLDSGFASPASDVYTPSLVTVLPKFQGWLVVHVFPADWSISGDLRGVQLFVVTEFPGETEGGAANEEPDSTESD